jgi:HNH endonuclease
MNPHYLRVAQRAAHACEYCHAPEAAFNLPFEVEHVVPRVHAGLDADSNWALSCRSCNLHKSSSLEGLDPETQTLAKLFHPRQQTWGHHFRVETATGCIVGTTPAGRATVERLRMNSPAQLAARRHWMRLRIFPPD